MVDRRNLVARVTAFVAAALRVGPVHAGQMASGSRPETRHDGGSEDRAAMEVEMLTLQQPAATDRYELIKVDPSVVEDKDGFQPSIEQKDKEARRQRPWDEILAELRCGVTPEEAITACLEGIRKRYANVDDTPAGDFYERWAKALLNERPIIVVSVLAESSVGTWVMDPHTDQSIYAGTYYWRINQVGVRDDLLSYSETQLREHVSWMWREEERTDPLEDGKPWLPPEQRDR